MNNKPDETAESDFERVFRQIIETQDLRGMETANARSATGTCGIRPGAATASNVHQKLLARLG